MQRRGSAFHRSYRAQDKQHEQPGTTEQDGSFDCRTSEDGAFAKFGYSFDRCQAGQAERIKTKRTGYQKPKMVRRQCSSMFSEKSKVPILHIFSPVPGVSSPFTETAGPREDGRPVREIAGDCHMLTPRAVCKLTPPAI